MKKTYIEPKNTVVALKVRDNVMANTSNDMRKVTNTESLGSEDFKPAELDLPTTYDGEALGRESLNAWDEW